MIIDSHIHLFHPDIMSDRKKFLCDDNFALLYPDEKSKLASIDNVLSYMDAEKIDKCVAMGFQWCDESLCRAQNEYFAKIQSDTGGRIICFGSIPVDKNTDFSKAAGDIKKLGLYGAGEIAFYHQGFNNDNKKILSDILCECRKNDLPVCLHLNEPVGHKYSGKYDPGLWDLYPLLEEFSDLRMIFPHWGGGLFFYELMPEVKKAFTNFYFDTSASPYIYSPDIYSRAIDIIGPDRILFGSDFPILKMGRYINEMNEKISEDNRKKILGMNAFKLFNRKP